VALSRKPHIILRNPFRLIDSTVLMTEVRSRLFEGWQHSQLSGSRYTFDVDVEHCPNCGGALKSIATIDDPPGIVKILSHLRSTLDSCGDCVGDARALDTRAAGFHGKGLAVSVRPSAGESSLAPAVAKIRGAMGCGRACRLC